MTVEKNGITLLIPLVNGADLLAMSHSLQYHDVIVERLWMYIGLVLLTIGLFQMAFIDTDGLTPSSTLNSKGKLKKRIHFLQDQNLCPLFRVKSFIVVNLKLPILMLLDFVHSRWSPSSLSNIISRSSAM